jgi:heme exporter protein D
MSEFFAMDGYANYIWSAWGISALALIGLLVWTLSERRAAEARLSQLEEDQL